MAASRSESDPVIIKKYANRRLYDTESSSYITLERLAEMVRQKRDFQVVDAKSGVSGGVIAVLPGQLGIGVFSPRLDARGNSVRGIRLCERLSRHWDLHLFNRPAVGKAAIRMKSTALEIASNRVRTTAELQVLRTFGASIQLYQLQGNLAFTAAEVVVRDGGDDVHWPACVF